MDAQCPHQVRIVEKVAVGAEFRGMNAGNRAQIVELIGIAGDPDRAQKLAGLVADKLAAAFQK
jgi:hypothetical protein